jgi:hypothetical protein
LLDIDDLIIMKMLREKQMYKDIGGVLNISNPAISHRISRVKIVLDDEVFTRCTKRRELTEKGRKFADLCIKGLDALLEDSEDEDSGSSCHIQ